MKITIPADAPRLVSTPERPEPHCEACGLVRFLEQPEGAPCVACLGQARRK